MDDVTGLSYMLIILSSLVKWMTSYDSYSCLLFLGKIRREEEEAGKFLSKVDDVT